MLLAGARHPHLLELPHHAAQFVAFAEGLHLLDAREVLLVLHLQEEHPLLELVESVVEGDVELVAARHWTSTPTVYHRGSGAAHPPASDTLARWQRRTTTRPPRR